MNRVRVSAVLLLLLCAVFLSSSGQKESEYKTSDWTKTLTQLKDWIKRLHSYYTYFRYAKSAVDVIVGSDQRCQFKCSDVGEKPFPRPGYISSPNGCGTPLVGFHIDIRIPSITNCCNKHDRCYDTCGQKKRDCDDQFQVCLKTICRNLLNVLGLDQRVQACESGVSLVFDAIEYLGCEPYLKSQRAACVCRYDYKIDL